MATAGAQVRETTSPTVKQFSVFLLNKVGALLEIIRVLNESQVHVIGLNSQDSTDSALVRIIVSDPEAVEQIFDLHEVKFLTCTRSPTASQRYWWLRCGK